VPDPQGFLPLPESVSSTSAPRRPQRRPEDYPVRMTRRVASAYLEDVHGLNRHKPNTLAKFAVEGRGPRFQKFGRWVLYRRDDLDLYATQCLSPAYRSTAEHATAQLRDPSLNRRAPSEALQLSAGPVRRGRGRPRKAAT
jgi:hypothetical protein